MPWESRPLAANDIDQKEALHNLLVDQYGFWPSPRKLGDLFYSGIIKVGNEQVIVELRLPNSLLLEPPDAFLVDWGHSPELRGFLGTRHIESNGRICFYDPSRDVWDATTSIRHLAGVVEKISNILNANIAGSKDEAWLQDFQGYWRGDKVYLASKPENGKIFNLWHYREKVWLIDSDSNPDWMEADKKFIDRWYVVELDNIPAPTTENWPPKSVRLTLRWFSGFIESPELYIAKILLREKFSKKTKGTHTLSKGFIFYGGNTENPQYFALKFTITKKLQEALRQKRLKGVASLLKSTYFNAPIEAFSPQRADPEYIHSRNLPDGTKTLNNLYVLQVGAGAIGSFLAHQLAALGAGWGKNAQFTIVDPDKFSTENMGRHILGVDSVSKYKAFELRDHIKTTFPHLNVTGNNGSILRDEMAFAKKPDIILNATGSEEVSIAIELLLSSKYNQSPPIIHGWILGHGLAAQSFIRPAHDSPCYMCLWEGEGEHRRRRHELSKNPESDLPVFAPCHHSFYPFIVNVAVTAANLMIEQLREHLQSKTGQTLIHYIFQKDKCFNRSNATPSKSTACPICNADKHS